MARIGACEKSLATTHVKIDSGKATADIHATSRALRIVTSETVATLICYSLVLGAGFAWIARDAETAQICGVFGRDFKYWWCESGARWTTISKYGWRLLLFVAMIGTLTYAAWRLETGWRVPLAILPFCLLPWVNISACIRHRHYLRNLTEELTPLVGQISADPKTQLENADYLTASDWTAWHPKPCYDWPDGVVPIAYVHELPANAVVFPILGFTGFLAWKADGLIAARQSLPFRGPDDCTFSVTDIRLLRGTVDWSIVQADVRWVEGDKPR